MQAPAFQEPVGAAKDSVAVADYYNIRSYSDTNEVDGGK